MSDSSVKLLWHKLRYPLIIMAGALIFGIVGYSIIFPEASLEKIIFMTGITLSTVGYGDILGVEKKTSALYFTMLLMVVGMGAVLYAISNITAFVVEGHVAHIFSSEKMKRRLKKMKDHYIICGCGKTGIHVIREMHDTEQKYVAVELDPERITKVRETIPDSVIFHGDANDDSFFEKVNLASARGLVAALSNDKDNLYLCLSAKIYNPEIKIVTRAFDMEMYQKFRKVGADYIVSPNFIGGLRIASEILRPHVVTFLDKMLRSKDGTTRVEESAIPKGDPRFSHKSTLDFQLFEHTGVNILAYSNDGINYHYNPSPRYKFRGGETILYICTNEQKKLVDNFFSDKV